MMSSYYTAPYWPTFGVAAILASLSTTDAHAGARVVQRKLAAARADAAQSQVSAPASAAVPDSTRHPIPGVQVASIAPPSELGPESLGSRQDAALPTLPVTTPLSESDELAASETDLFGRRGTGIQLGARAGVVRRSLEFSQDVYGRMRAINTNLYVYRLDAALYPSFRLPALEGRVGLIAGYEGAFAGAVRDTDFGGEYDASLSELFGGVRVRHPVRKHAFGFELTMGRLESGLEDQNGASGTPDVSYTELRSALDAALRFQRIHVGAAAGFRVPLSYGELSDREWFPRVGGYGLEASGSAKYLLAPNVSVELSASLRRFVLEMNAQPEDGSGGVSEIVGGAVDMYLAAYAGMSFAL
jgi:hypothetical protein